MTYRSNKKTSINKNVTTNNKNKLSIVNFKNKKASLSKKAKIPKKIREEVWVNYNGPCFEKKCNVSWCNNIINVFNYHVGHDIPESKGGTLDIVNLKPICSNCNLSMGNNFTITEWSNIGINERSKIKNLKLYLNIMSISIVSILSYLLFNNYSIIYTIV